MGLTNDIINFQEEIITKVGLQWQNIKMCELGSMNVRFMNNIPAKRYYIEEKNILEHISIDWNGKNGSLPIDLCFSVPEDLLDRFHVITDFGTIEHVDNQYQVFKNIHDMCSIEGVMIHVSPSLNYWKFHCRYLYSKEFFLKLAELCKYEILDLKIKNCCDPPRYKRDLVYVALLKQNNNEFISEKEFNALSIFDIENPDNISKFNSEKILYNLWKSTNIPAFRRFFQKILRSVSKVYVNIKKKRG